MPDALEPRSLDGGVFFEHPAAAIGSSQLTSFSRRLERHAGTEFADHAALQRFSVAEADTFWRFFLDSSALRWEGQAEPVRSSADCATAVFFANVRLNYAENLLAALPDAGAAHPAITSCHADGSRERLTRGQLRARVLHAASELRRLGIGPGDRVAAVMRNDAAAVIATLAVTAIGATIATTAPDLGTDAILSRFTPVAPRLLIAHTAPLAADLGVPLAVRVAEIAAGLPTLQAVLTLDACALPGELAVPTHRLDALSEEVVAEDADGALAWTRLPFNHPLFIMFSSGTTGAPKAIVHGAGGTLIEHVKEHRLHCDLRPADRLFFQTSCAWMMWHWQLSALASGVELFLYDGPLASARTLWDIVAAGRVTVFGTSPGYLSMCEAAGFRPSAECDLGDLRAILSTGAILHAHQYGWVRDHVKHVALQSISGGTDIIGCFVLGNPNIPVRAGLSQCRSLGLDVQTLRDAEGALAAADDAGELICANPFPSRPLGFLADPDGSRFRRAYFAANPGVWTHGDLIAFAPDGGARLLGRVDGVLNVRGINVGPAEIYAALQGLPEIGEAMAVQQRLPGESGEGRVVLLLVLRGAAELDGALAGRIRRELARRASAAHVPDIIVRVDDLPMTHSGKRSEAAVAAAVNGRPIGNLGALRNPACLEAIRRHPALRPSAKPSLPDTASLESIEQDLRAYWEALFHVAPIGPQDDFFELGGHSLLAAAMLAEVRRVTGRDLPIAAMLHAPTIARLAAVIRNTDWSMSSSVVPLRVGTGTPPLFLVHSLAGTVLEMWAFGRAFSGELPIYGIQARGLDGTSPPHRRVEGMAADYLGQIRAIQPTGPYALGGFSFGGLVAFEMARRLAASGETVELVALGDTDFAPNCLPWRHWLRYHAGRLARSLRTVRHTPSDQRLAHFGGLATRMLDRVLIRLGRQPISPPVSVAALAADLPPTLRRIRNSVRIAAAAYRPGRYSGRVMLFRAAKRNPFNCDPLAVWQRAVGRGLQVVPVQCDHTALMADPHVQVVAATIAEALRKPSKEAVHP